MDNLKSDEVDQLDEAGFLVHSGSSRRQPTPLELIQEQLHCFGYDHPELIPRLGRLYEPMLIQLEQVASDLAVAIRDQTNLKRVRVSPIYTDLGQCRVIDQYEIRNSVHTVASVWMDLNSLKKDPTLEVYFPFGFTPEAKTIKEIRESVKGTRLVVHLED